MHNSWKCSRPDWMRLWETWSIGNCLWPLQGVGTKLSLRSFQNQTILWVWVPQVPSQLEVKGIICWPSAQYQDIRDMSEQALSLKVRLVPEGNIFMNVELAEHNIFYILIFPINRPGTLVLHTQFCSTSSRCIFFCLNHSKIWFVKKKLISSEWKSNSDRRKILTIKAVKVSWKWESIQSDTINCFTLEQSPTNKYRLHVEDLVLPADNVPRRCINCVTLLFTGSRKSFYLSIG